MAQFSTKTTITVNTSLDNAWTTPLEWGGVGGNAAHPLLLRSASYAELYVRQLWVRAAVDKLANLHITPPLKSYRKSAAGRVDASGGSYGRLIACPNPRISCVEFWRWTASTYHIYGESFLHKARRDGDGVPTQLWPVHPTRMRYGVEWGGYDGTNHNGLDGSTTEQWWFRRNDGQEIPIPRRDLVVFKRNNPQSVELGLSPLEALRETLEAESANRKSVTNRHRNGGQSKLALKYQSNFGNSPAVAERLREQFSRKHAGPENAGRPLILEDGIEPVSLPVGEGLEYIAERELNRQEVAATYDLPAYAIGADGSGSKPQAAEVRQQLYRETMPPIFEVFEGVLDHDLRDGRFGADRRPDFGSQNFAKWDLDGVLRGSFEERIRAGATAIQTGQRTSAELREADDLPFVEYSDQLFVNAAVVPIEQAAEGLQVDTGSPADSGVTQDGDGGTETPLPQSEELVNPRPAQRPTAVNSRGLFGHLGRVEEIDDIEIAQVAILTPVESRPLAVAALEMVRNEGGTVADYRNALKTLGV